MSQGNVDVLKLRARGKAKVSTQSGNISLQADDPVGALQAIARQASIRIDLTADEVALISGAGKLDISLSYANNVAGATEAAKSVFRLVGEKGQKIKPGLWKMLGFGSLVLTIGVLVFILTYRMLEKVYG